MTPSRRGPFKEVAPRSHPQGGHSSHAWTSGQLTGPFPGRLLLGGPPQDWLTGCLPRGPLPGETFEGPIQREVSLWKCSSEQDRKEVSPSSLAGSCSPGPLPILRLLGAKGWGEAHPEVLPRHPLSGDGDRGSPHRGYFKGVSPRRDDREMPSPGGSQEGLSSERPLSVPSMDVSQEGSSPEGPRRDSSTEELPRLAPRSPLRVPLHRTISPEPVNEATPLWRFFGTSLLGPASGARRWPPPRRERR